jgi:hypothetical protein
LKIVEPVGRPEAFAQDREPARLPETRVARLVY